MTIDREVLDPRRSPQRGLAGSIKRGCDIASVVVTAPLTLPLATLVALGVRFTMGAPVLFRQRRTGFLGRPFHILKFRTMRPPRSGEDAVASDADRMTAVGRLLRRTSLDELPSLWNVLVGDMSLVGPRPLMNDYRPLYSDRQYERHLCRPGLTGLAQVEGRNLLSWEERFELDLDYGRTWRLRRDLWILLRTVRHVVIGSGVEHAQGATMHRFEGSKQHGRD